MRRKQEQSSGGDDLVEALAPARGSLVARDYLFLAEAYFAAHAYAKALESAAAGLALEPRHAALIAARGDAKDGLGDEDGALADWQLAQELRLDRYEGATSR